MSLHRGNVTVSGKGTGLLRNRALDNTTERKLVFLQPAATDIKIQQGNVPLSSISTDILHSNSGVVRRGQPWRADVPYSCCDSPPGAGDGVDNPAIVWLWETGPKEDTGDKSDPTTDTTASDTWEGAPPVIASLEHQAHLTPKWE